MNTSRFRMLIGLAIMISACTNTPDLGAELAADTAFLEASGSWRVSYFWDKDKEETDDFNGYEFFFESNGVFRVVPSSGQEVVGNWRRSRDDGFERLVLQIPGTKPLEEVNDDWILLKMEDKLIILQDDRSGPETESLHFSR